MEFYEFKKEMPADRSDEQISIPKFMLAHQDDEINEERITARDIVRLISLIGICWFFCYLDNNIIIGLIGMIASTSALCLTGDE